MSFETTTDDVLDGVDLRGKIAIVTGAVDRHRAGDGACTGRGRRPRGARRSRRGADRRRRQRRTRPGPRCGAGSGFARPRVARERARVRPVVLGDARPAASADQQRGRDVHTAGTHRRRLRDAVRHQPRRAFFPDQPVGADAPRRSTVPHRQPQLGRAPGIRHRVGRSQLRTARVRQVLRVRPVQDRQHPLLRRARPSSRRSWGARVRGAPGHDRDRARSSHDARTTSPRWWNVPSAHRRAGCRRGRRSSRAPPPPCGPPPPPSSTSRAAPTSPTPWSPTSTRPGPATPSPPPASGPSPRTSSDSASPRLTPRAHSGAP